MTLYSRVRQPRELSASEIDAMFDLMSRHYDNISRSSFIEDLFEKQWVIELREEPSKHLRGFSTQRLVETVVDETPVAALFSGDTIVAKEYWGSTLLAISWGQLALRMIKMNPGKELYWFLICKGFRTYRFLSVFFEEFDPCWHREMPPYHRRVLERLAQEKYGAQYDPGRGILLADKNAYRIKPEIDARSERSDPHIAFFLQRNPGYQRGDELCCLTRLTLDNFSRAAKRLMATKAFARDST